MTSRNPNWNNLNTLRPWPFDATATLTDDTGKAVPTEIIADLLLRFPASLGVRAWISALSVTPHLVTCVISSASGDFQTLASISTPLPQFGQTVHTLRAHGPGIGGWIVWGTDLEQYQGVWRFSSPQQTLLMPRTAWPYTSLPVTTLSIQGMDQPLRDLVKLQAGNDIRITKQIREIAGVLREAIVFELDTENTAETGRNILNEYRGPCQTRPESGTCADGFPIEFINNVAPDCCGRIQIVLTGCVAVSQINENGECGVEIACPITFDDACTREKRLPDEHGKLPNEFNDLCEEISSEIIVLPRS